jgi:hypothetical protein
MTRTIRALPRGVVRLSGEDGRGSPELGLAHRQVATLEVRAEESLHAPGRPAVRQPGAAAGSVRGVARLREVLLIAATARTRREPAAGLLRAREVAHHVHSCRGAVNAQRRAAPGRAALEAIGRSVRRSTATASAEAHRRLARSVPTMAEVLAAVHGVRRRQTEGDGTGRRVRRVAAVVLPTAEAMAQTPGRRVLRVVVVPPTARRPVPVGHPVRVPPAAVVRVMDSAREGSVLRAQVGDR